MRMNLESGNLWSSGMNTKWVDFLSVGLSCSSSLCSVIYLWIGTVLFMSAAFSNAMSLYVFITSLLLFAFTVFSSAFYAHSHPVSHLTTPPTPPHPPASLSLRLRCLPQLFSVVLCALCCRDRTELCWLGLVQNSVRLREEDTETEWKRGERVRFMLTRADWINSWKQLDLSPFLCSWGEGLSDTVDGCSDRAACW